MKKQIIYFVVLLVLLIIASCSVEPVSDEEFEEAIGWGDYRFGNNIMTEDGSSKTKTGIFSYSGTVPDATTSKIPVCNDKEPAYVHFDITDSNGNLWVRESPVTNENGLWVSEPDSLPIGMYEVQKTYLLSEELDTLYAIPHISEVEFHDYATTVLPVDLQINDTPKSIEGNALCFTPNENDELRYFGDGITTQDLQLITIYITGLENYEEPSFYDNDGNPVYNQKTCVDLVQITVDALITKEFYTYNRHVKYQVHVPKEYRFIDFFTYSVDDGVTKSIERIQFTEENPYSPEDDGPIVFDECL